MIILKKIISAFNIIKESNVIVVFKILKNTS